ncbi:hypothetical protein MAPG_10301 [Magnaporthiopsis poae ATCC 64411]|uniref:Uncharacterized protein n=1 Tax=Magnaporthiopsis poae (strain ATCC 64411 / 73-15) TaxID=644358 RepID=A0A0C4EC87_MAGP6|nr:hypothetical protein MAPG_10301 [Magnaporthiopsis poae ATCC 64411]
MSVYPRTTRTTAVLFVSSAFLFFLLLSRQITVAAAMASPDVLSKLAVSIRQSSSSPPTLAVKVTNGNDIPVTILTWDSPLDPAALSLDVVRITPAGAAAPLELPRVMFRRLMPPDAEALETVEAGGIVEREIVLKDAVVSPEELFVDGGPARVRLKGRWNCVWAKRREEIGAESLERMAGGDDAVEGDFESNEVEVRA